MARRKYLRDARGRFVSKATWLRLVAAKSRKPIPPRPRRRFTREEEHLLDDLRPAARRGRVLPAGTEFELTVTYRRRRK